MTDQAQFGWPIWFAIANTVAMVIASVFVFFFHERKHEDIESWIDFSFSLDMLKRVVGYYRTMAALMGLVFVVFVISMFALQKGAGLTLFAEGEASMLGMAFFALDLVLRGAFFDWMEHFDWSISPLTMNRELFWFVIYAFVFRMFFALTLLKILISFAWIWRKIQLAKREVLMGTATAYRPRSVGEGSGAAGS
ncbi:MAG: hypothetical protein R3D33_07710 [Hyphomicrobiaceae bacterium]